ncbi:TetR/AcrR family transcriptional regulator [Nonomuraea typhae]|uniref:TetR/AcrR family transcriptional regulator n=1 Tax=Nonomuraea typhae TaxID=2603600 RepID=UPI0012F940AD|nr:TetR/AcrR family transcriptional regulator [Nonomuraea typhae]
MTPESRTFIEEARRAQIITCAIDALATLGFRNASMTQIAKLAKITPGVISYHFGSKDELIKAVVGHVVELATGLMVPRIMAQTTAATALAAYIESNLDFMRVHRKPLLALVEIIVADRDGPYSGQQESALEDLENVLTWGQENGEFRDFDRRAMAIAIRGAIDAVPTYLISNPDYDLGHLATELISTFELATRRPA